MFATHRTKYSITNRGKDVLIDCDNYEYVVSKVVGNSWHWECRYRKKERCHGTAISQGKGEEARIKIGGHCHPSDIAKTTVNVLLPEHFPDPRLILDLPTEVMQNVVFQHLPCTDIRKFTEIGSQRLKEISEDHLKRTCDVYCKFLKLF